MTVAELHRLATRRSAAIRAAGDRGFSVRVLRRWLDGRVNDGWLVKRRGRYYLTTEGFWIAQALGGMIE